MQYISQKDRVTKFPSPIAKSPQSRILSTKIHIPPLKIIPPISRKNNLPPRTPLNSKRSNKNQQLSTPTNPRSNNIIILDKPLRPPPSHIELYEETDGEEHEDAGIDADGEETEVPADYGGDEVLEAGGGEATVEEVGWEGD